MLDLNINDTAAQTSDYHLLFSTKQGSGTCISSGDSTSMFDKRVSNARLITRQLFPVSGVEIEKTLRSYEIQEEVESHSQWLNLSVSESVAVGDNRPPPRMKKSRRGPRSRSSQFRGVTFYRRTGRWESHIWDCGRQVYLGGFDTAHAAARAYDRAAVKFRGPDADINFTASDYADDLKNTKDLTKQEFVHIIRRQSSVLSRGSPKYRGVTLHKNGRWETQMDQFLGKKACNKAAVECNGPIAETNFDPETCHGDVSVANKNQESADTHHNLDLSLWISPPSISQKGNNSARSLCLRDAASHLSGVKRTKVERFAPAPNGRETPHYLPSWPGNHSGSSPNYEVTSIKDMETQVVPSLGISNWAWQTNSQGVVIPLTLFSTAASSGFSSSLPPITEKSVQETLLSNTFH